MEYWTNFYKTKLLSYYYPQIINDFERFCLKFFLQLFFSSFYKMFSFQLLLVYFFIPGFFVFKFYYNCYGFFYRIRFNEHFIFEFFFPIFIF